MTNAQPQELHEDLSEGSSWSSASKLSRKVRELAHRSYRALKADAQSQDGFTDIQQDLRDLRDQVARLQQKIHARQLSALIPWVDALRQQVEARLDNAGRARTP
jgi:SMC interacting uncharacterized protein involved in chromosome segregation